MALFQKSRILSQERLDLPDFKNIEDFVCADFKAIFKYTWTDKNFVLSGFQSTGTGTNTLSIVLAGSSAVFGEDDGVMYIGAPSLSALTTSSFTPSATNYIELIIEQDSGGADSRAFWDETALDGAGSEFSQIVDTFLFNKATINSNSSNFSGDAFALPICEVDVNGSGTITAIRDARNMFWRLGRASNISYAFPWASRVEPANTSFTGADKDIKNFKDWADAIMDSIREIKGLNYWYETSSTSITGNFRTLGLTTLVGLTPTARIAWSGTNLSITDANGTPLDSDEVAALRVFDSVANLKLTRQAGANSLALADGDILWIEIPDPLANTTYDSTGILLTNYRISPRGSVPLTQNVYWLAYREGTKIYLRGLGELEAGEEKQINDTITTALLTWLGFDPEVATFVPYTATPDPANFGNLFGTSDTLVTAISTNTANINAIGVVLNTNAYVEKMTVVPGIPVDDNEIQGPVTIGTNITIPLDSRDGNNQEEYEVGEGLLKIFLNGQLLMEGDDWLEVGTIGTFSDTIQIQIPLVVGDILQYRIDSNGGFNVGSGAGSGDVTGGANLGTGLGEVFKQKTAGILQFRKILAGAGINVITSGDDIIISLVGGSPEPYFVNYITGYTTTLIAVGNNYNVGTYKLDVYRNGVLMLKTNSLGSPVDRYQEATSSEILVATAPVASEVFVFVNQSDTPSYKNLITGVTGVTLTVPAYTMGNDSLRVWRNGILMNAAGMGASIDQYTEATTTTLTLATAAVATDVFTVASGPIPSFREDITGVAGTVVTLSSAYSIGSEELLVYKNGVLMYNSVSLGSSADRYQETGVTQITLESAIIASEVITVINK